jgi:hypothetical protein
MKIWLIREQSNVLSRVLLPLGNMHGKQCAVVRIVTDDVYLLARKLGKYSMIRLTCLNTQAPASKYVDASMSTRHQHHDGDGKEDDILIQLRVLRDSKHRQHVRSVAYKAETRLVDLAVPCPEGSEISQR